MKDSGTQGHSMGHNVEEAIMQKMGDEVGQCKGIKDHMGEGFDITDAGEVKDSMTQDLSMGHNAEEVIMTEMGDEVGHSEEVQGLVSDDNTCRESLTEPANLIQADRYSIGRQQPKADGIYLNGKLEDITIFFTIDTGAVKSVISKRIYDKIPILQRPALEKSSMLTTVNGDPLVEFGKALFKIKLSNVELSFEFIVADIQDDGLIGINVLMYNDIGEAEINLKASSLELGHERIPIIRVGSPLLVRKVLLADNYSIPPLSEKVVNAYVQRIGEGDNSSQFLIEPSRNFLEKNSVKLANCLIDTKEEVTNKVRVLNPFSSVVQLYEDTCIGFAEEIEGEVILIPEQGDDANESTLRQVNTMETPSKVPEHLQDIFNQASEGRRSEKIELIRKVLCQFFRFFFQI